MIDGLSRVAQNTTVSQEYIYIYIKTKNLSVEKERSIDSKAQKKTNKITKFRINAFL